MSALLDRVPADITGLVQRGSPLLRGALRGVVFEMPPATSAIVIHWRGECAEVRRAFSAAYALDLTDPTGRAHAAWYVRAIGVQHVSTEEWHLLNVARDGRDMTPEQIATLARLVYRAAGRLP